LQFAICNLICFSSPIACAQSASLYGAPGVRQELTLPGSSWYFRQLEPPRPIQRQDIITVIVDEKSQVISEGEVQRRKRAIIDARLQDWIRFDGLDLKPAPQADGDPRIRGSINSELRNEMELETRDGMRFRISARVVDIQPNGNLVLEARRHIQNNNEVWEQKLSGIVHGDDVLPNRTVLSEKIYDLKIEKCEQGHVRDAYKRGWLLRIVDKFKPF
jgi:flagellar L-ring protein precursor FlgH